MWGTAETNNAPFVELSSQLLDSLKGLAGHVIGIIEVCGVFLLHFHSVLFPNLFDFVSLGIKAGIKVFRVPFLETKSLFFRLYYS